MSTDTDISLDEVMTRRFELAEQVDLMEARHKAELAPLKDEIALCESFVQAHMLEHKTDQVKVNGNLAFFQSYDGVTMGDFDAFIACVRENDAWHLLNKAANKTAVKEWIEEYKAPPPGVNYTSGRKVHFRRGKAT